jgi:hypothetical protein
VTPDQKNGGHKVPPSPPGQIGLREVTVMSAKNKIKKGILQCPEESLEQYVANMIKSGVFVEQKVHQSFALDQD